MSYLPLYLYLTVIVIVSSAGKLNAQDYWRYLLELDEFSKIESTERSASLHSSSLENLKLTLLKEKYQEIGFPQAKKDDLITHHPGFSLLYNSNILLPRWVAHLVTPDVQRYNLPRPEPEQFYTDTLVLGKMAGDASFKKLKGYDRGHMAPAGDLDWSEAALAASFFYSNVAPQLGEFNRGIWRSLEDSIRVYVNAHEYQFENYWNGTEVFVITGPVVPKRKWKKTSKSNAAEIPLIPKSYFKILLDLKHGRGIGFILPQDANKSHNLKQYAVPINKVERKTGLNFFPSLPNELERILEKQCIPEEWLLKQTFTGFSKPISRCLLEKPTLNSRQLIKRYQKLTEEEKKTKSWSIAGRVTDRKFVFGNLSLFLDTTFKGKELVVYIPSELRKEKFNYDPFKELRGAQIMVNGVITEKENGRLQLTISSPGDITFLFSSQ